MILYYTNNKKEPGFTKRVYERHRQQAIETGQDFLAVVAEKIGEGDIILPETGGPKYSDIYHRILRGIFEIPRKEVVYLAEDDVLYPNVRYLHKKLEPGTMYYNRHLVYICGRGYFWAQDGCLSLSQAFGTSGAIGINIVWKLEECQAGKMNCCEPVTEKGKPYVTDVINCEVMSIDFRGVNNSTWSEPGPRFGHDGTFFQDCWGWPPAVELWESVTGKEAGRGGDAETVKS